MVKMSNGIVMQMDDNMITDMINENKIIFGKNRSDLEIINSIRSIDKEKIIDGLLRGIFKKEDLDLLYNGFIEKLDEYEQNISDNFKVIKGGKE